ncbi:RNA polymerase sigma factor [Clostridium frigoris]|uniref:RNA polymerase sigma factor n=1 Tax=Clostridium frigoris TaxID=205327 RepID=UPI0031B8745D
MFLKYHHGFLELQLIDIMICVEQKNLLILKYNMDLSYKEISNVLDINESTVKTYLFRAREQFKNKWGVMYNE